MAYREILLRGARPQLTMDGQGPVETFDLDCFGMDDGAAEDPDAAFRFIFQLGLGWMIYLYVVQAGGRARPDHFFHTFWIKDCAVAYVEMEELGPPSELSAGPFDVPVLYPFVELGDRRYAVRRQTFAATDPKVLSMTFALEAPDASPHTLLWRAGAGWTLDDRPLQGWLRFAD